MELTGDEGMPSSDLSFSVFRKSFASRRRYTTERGIELLQNEANSHETALELAAQVNKIL